MDPTPPIYHNLVLTLVSELRWRAPLIGVGSDDWSIVQFLVKKLFPDRFPHQLEAPLDRNVIFRLQDEVMALRTRVEQAEKKIVELSASADADWGKY